jgi:hypothetical protein
VQFMEGAADEPVAEAGFAGTPSGRNRSQVAAELKEATAALVAAMARPAGQLAASHAAYESEENLHRLA